MSRNAIQQIYTPLSSRAKPCIFCVSRSFTSSAQSHAKPRKAPSTRDAQWRNRTRYVTPEVIASRERKHQDWMVNTVAPWREEVLNSDDASQKELRWALAIATGEKPSSFVESNLGWCLYRLLVSWRISRQQQESAKDFFNRFKNIRDCMIPPVKAATGCHVPLTSYQHFPRRWTTFMMPLAT